MNLTFDVYSIYVTESEESWIRQSINRIKKIQKLMSLEQVENLKVNDLLNYGMKASGFLETRSFNQVNRYEIFIDFDEAELLSIVTRSNSRSTVSSRSYIQLRVTESIEEDFKEFEQLVLRSRIAD